MGELTVYVGAVEIAIPICFFLVTSLAEFWGKGDKPASAHSRLRTFQLALTALIIALSTAHAALLAVHLSLDIRTDPFVATALFKILEWVIFFLPLLDREGDAAYPHYGAWTMVLVFEIPSFLLNLSSCAHKGTNHMCTTSPLALIGFVVLLIRLIAIAGLLAGSRLAKRSVSGKEEGTPDETQPLLNVESRTAEQEGVDKNDQKDGADGQNDEDDDEDENRWDDSSENEGWEADITEMKKRSWAAYMTSFKIFLPYIRPRERYQYFYFAVMIACSGASRVLNVLTPLSLRATVNGLEDAKSVPWSALAAYLGLTLISSSAGISVVESLASLRMSRGMQQSLNHYIYDHVMNLDAKFHDSKKTAILNRAMDRGDAVTTLFQEFFFQFMPTVADLVISLAVLQWLFGAYVCFIVAMTATVFTWSNTKLIKNRTGMRRKYIDALCAAYDFVWETQYNWTTVAQFNQVELEKGNYRRKNNARIATDMELQTYTEVTRCTRQLIVTTGFICAVLIAVTQIVHGHRSVGDFVMLITYWNQVMAPVRSIISTITSVSERLVDVEKLLLVLEKEPDVKDPPGAIDFDFQGGSVDFQNVTFSYDGERTVTEGITFHADAGQTIALVGETGGGKSTLLKLLYRFYDPKEGHVLIDGQDLQEVKSESFRKMIGIVPQDPALFNRSIFDNVRYPDNTATMEEVQAACKAACLHDKIMTFPKQYKEKVGERGTKLSGGETQRLAIARAILKKPKMLLLDEATSAVDSVTESKIQAALKQLCKGRTTFVIAHRLSTILHADLVMVIKGGKLMEMGPHRTLIKRKGAYRELWDAQLNMQLQDPGIDDDDNENNHSDDEDKPAKKKKKPSMFYNDMGKEKIDESMLYGGQDGSEDDVPESEGPGSAGSHKVGSSDPVGGARRVAQQGQLLTDSSGNPGEVGSEDVTEIGSGDEGGDDKNKH